MKIDIHNCPERSKNYVLPIPYIVAVMNAANDGKQLQSRCGDEWFDIPTGNCLWSWNIYSYRIKKEDSDLKIGKYLYAKSIGLVFQYDGTQMLTPSCYRLATNEEIRSYLLKEAEKKGFVVGAKALFHQRIIEIKEVVVVRDEHDEKGEPFVCVSGDGWSYPIKILTIVKEKKRVPLDISDLPPVFWIKNTQVQYLVTCIHHNNLCYGKNMTSSLKELCDDTFWQYSPDRINWKPLYKEVEV